MLTLETLAVLRSPEGAALLAEAEAEIERAASELVALTRLRGRHNAELATAALETVTLRRRARAKFSRAAAMFFTREGLEQASSEAVAAQTAARFAAFATVADLCCGLGGNTLALAALTRVIAVDRDPLRLALALANAEPYGVAGNVETRCAALPDGPLPAAEAAFCDPGRRGERGRTFDPERYEPPLSAVLALRGRYPALGIKVAPGIRDEALPPDCEAEFVQLGGELKQATLWCGPLASATRRATLLPSGATLCFDANAPPPAESEPRAYLYEPEPAAIRARLVAQLARDFDAAQLDVSTAFLTGDRLVATPFAVAFAVDEWLPFNLKLLRARLRAMGVGRVVVKKRGSPLDPQALERDLRLSGEGEERTIVLTHVRGRHSAIICRRVDPENYAP
jgi:SAM-dependent methyltransferase